MSTFNGLVKEFPEIRIDYFRLHPEKIRPSACFLSHVHSDHLQGLESLKMPFVYCSAATKRMLLQMEKYPHRINFAKGILEARKQTYKHLKLVLRALPLQTPIKLELSPRSTIQVTLFDSNHCPGAVMFLIEGNGKAILYTGDVRAESWWVNSIIRNPVMLPYSSGHKRLDCIYLDTTFASHNKVYKRFPSMAEGLTELMYKAKKCPKDTVFYFRAWTLGYEDVWLTLSNLLESKVHVDEYQIRIFRSLMEGIHSIDYGAAMIGHHIGNQDHEGYLSLDQQTRIHSCEPGMPCHAALSKNQNVIWITPIISRLEDGTEVAEVGAGGGGGDLYQISELDMGDDTSLHALESLCQELIKDSDILSGVETILKQARKEGKLKLVLDDLALDKETEMTLKSFIQILSQRQTTKSPSLESKLSGVVKKIGFADNTIRFPYSRHSSYDELRELISAFRPNDICPCTVELVTWTEELSMQSLFGDLCSGAMFVHDRAIREVVMERQKVGNLTAGLKRKRGEEENSQRSESQQDATTSEEYCSAEASLNAGSRGKELENGTTHSVEDVPNILGESAIRPDIICRTKENLPEICDNLHSEWRTRNNGSETYRPSSSLSMPDCNLETEHDSQLSVSSSVFDSREQDRCTILQLQRDEPNGFERNHRTVDIDLRKAAYRIASRCLENGDYSRWDELHLRSTGWSGHTDEEIIL